MALFTRFEPDRFSGWFRYADPSSSFLLLSLKTLRHARSSELCEALTRSSIARVVVTGRLADLVPTKILVIFGLGASTLIMFQHATITTVTSMEAITFWFAIRGIARSFTIAPLTTASLATLPESEIRMGSRQCW